MNITIKVYYINVNINSYLTIQMISMLLLLIIFLMTIELSSVMLTY